MISLYLLPPMIIHMYSDNKSVYTNRTGVQELTVLEQTIFTNF